MKHTTPAQVRDDLAYTLNELNGHPSPNQVYADHARAIEALPDDDERLVYLVTFFRIASEDT